MACEPVREITMRLILIPVFLLLSSSVLAITPIEADTMKAKVLITNTVTFEEDGFKYNVEEASGRLSWFPRDNWLQNVESLSLEPEAERESDALYFQWDNPRSKESLTVNAVVETKNRIVPVRKRIPFPLQNVPEDISKYLVAGQITDQSPEIQQLAQKLVAGKNDAYQAVFALADWTTSNIEYSLASLGEPAIQKASDVLDSKWGKCDELTALFISLNRAVGIPARFVAGYSYTNSELFDRRWGGHGWAEVWLPGTGWIPFDVTYGEYGYLDAGHVALKIADDAKETSIDYSARGIDFNLKTEPLSIYVTPVEMSGHSDQIISINLDTPHDSVGFGSALLILATVTNNKDYYVSTRLDLAQTTKTEMLSDTYANILLKPHEIRTIPFLVKIDNLERGYTYEFPFRLTSRLGEEASIKIDVRENSPVYDENAYSDLITKYSEPKSQGSPFGITCDRGSPAYVGDTITHTCTIVGGIERRIESLNLCEKTCFTVSVENKRFIITSTNDEAGVFTKTYSTVLGGGESIFFVTSRSVTPTILNISVTNPGLANPDDLITAIVKLEHKGAVPEDMTVTLKVHHAEAEEYIEKLDRPATLRFVLPGKALRPGDNTLEVQVSYKDEIGTQRDEKKDTNIKLVNVGWPLRVAFWLEDTGQWLVDLVS